MVTEKSPKRLKKIFFARFYPKKQEATLGGLRTCDSQSVYRLLGVLLHNVKPSMGIPIITRKNVFVSLRPRTFHVLRNISSLFTIYYVFQFTVYFTKTSPDPIRVSSPASKLDKFPSLNLATIHDALVDIF